MGRSLGSGLHHAGPARSTFLKLQPPAQFKSAELVTQNWRSNFRILHKFKLKATGPIAGSDIISHRACLSLQRRPREVPAPGSGVKVGPDQEERPELRAPRPDPHPHLPSPSHLPSPPSHVQDVAAPSKSHQGKAGKGESSTTPRCCCVYGVVMATRLRFFTYIDLI